MMGGKQIIKRQSGELGQRVEQFVHDPDHDDHAGNKYYHMTEAGHFPEFSGKTKKALAGNPHVEIIATGVSLEVVLPGADLVITAMGVTVAEAHTLGLPVALLSNWPSDEAPVKRLVDEHMIADLGYGPSAATSDLILYLEALWSDTAGRQVFANNGWRLVDGQGARRSAQMISELLVSGEGSQC